MVTGRYSSRYLDAAAFYYRALPRHRAALAALALTDPGAARRLQGRYLLAGSAALRATPDLVADVQRVLNHRRRRVLKVQNGWAILRVVNRPNPGRDAYYALAFAAWLIRREPVLATDLLAVLQPPFEAALASLDRPVSPTGETAALPLSARGEGAGGEATPSPPSQPRHKHRENNQTIKQPPNPNLPGAPRLIVCLFSQTKTPSPRKERGQGER
jgi:hypothetical protein